MFHLISYQALSGVFLVTCCQKLKVSHQCSGFSNKKFQITKTKKITMTEIQNPKQVGFDLI